MRTELNPKPSGWKWTDGRGSTWTKYTSRGYKWKCPICGGQNPHHGWGTNSIDHASDCARYPSPEQARREAEALAWAAAEAVLAAACATFDGCGTIELDTETSVSMSVDTLRAMTERVLVLASGIAAICKATHRDPASWHVDGPFTWGDGRECWEIREWSTDDTDGLVSVVEPGDDVREEAEAAVAAAAAGVRAARAILAPTSPASVGDT